ncbi:MAG: tetratricopeptide repeat protein [candidate division KSB1 bacterium]|nr:tetratricopeptide repeat protein [candidate division KSB1 bacterium]
MNKMRSLRTAAKVLVICATGLFWVCAQQAVQAPGEDMSSEDEAFRDELLALLGEEGEGEVGTFTPQEEQAPSGEEDLSALLSSLEEQQVQPMPTTPAEDKTRTALIAEIRRLEALLEKRSSQVDSLRRILDNRNARIAELQAAIASARQAAPAYAAAPLVEQPSTRVVRRGGFEPLRGFSGPFVEKYNTARQKFESFDYQGCIDLMSELLASEPNHILADNAQYWIGESYYGLKQYQKALIEFQKVFSYEATDKYDDAQLMIGLCYVRMGQREQARQAFQEFLNTYAGSEYTGIAQRYLRTI